MSIRIFDLLSFFLGEEYYIKSIFDYMYTHPKGIIDFEWEYQPGAEDIHWGMHAVIPLFLILEWAGKPKSSLYRRVSLDLVEIQKRWKLAIAGLLHYTLYSSALKPCVKQSGSVSVTGLFCSPLRVRGTGSQPIHHCLKRIINITYITYIRY